MILVKAFLFTIIYLDYVTDIKHVMFNTESVLLMSAYERYFKKVPDSLTSQYTNRKTKEQAIVEDRKRRETQNMFYPNGMLIKNSYNLSNRYITYFFLVEIQSVAMTQEQELAAAVQPTQTNTTLRKERHCKSCKRPMKGHSKATCLPTL